MHFHKIALLLVVAPGVAAAAPHAIEVQISNGKTAFVQTVGISEGQQANMAGPVTGRDGRTRRQMIINAVIIGQTGRTGEFNVQYQVELSGGDGSEGPSIQGQGAVLMRPGDSLTAIECGRWTVNMSLDGSRANRKKKSSTWEAGGLANYRVTAWLSGDKTNVRCRQVLMLGTQGNVNDALRRPGKLYGFVMGALLGKSHEESGVDLRYQVSYLPVTAPVGNFQAQNQEALALGRKSASRNQGYRLDFLVEGEPLAKGGKAEAPAAQPPAASEERGPVPLLR